jgi:hypothetical protein
MVPEGLLPENHDPEFDYLSPEEMEALERSLHESTHQRYCYTMIIGQDGEPYFDVRVSNPRYLGPKKGCEECSWYQKYG